MTDSTAFALQRLADSIQIAILERGIQASSLTASWVGVAVGVLGVLFAAMAIATAFVLYRQTKEFHARAEQMVEQYRTIVDKVAEDARVMLSATNEDIKLQVASVTAELERTGVEQEATRKALEDRLKRLDERAAALDAISQPSVLKAVPVSSLWDLIGKREVQHSDPARAPLACSKCGWTESALANPRVMKGIKTCPMCFSQLSYSGS